MAISPTTANMQNTKSSRNSNYYDPLMPPVMPLPLPSNYIDLDEQINSSKILKHSNEYNSYLNSLNYDCQQDKYRYYNSKDRYLVHPHNFIDLVGDDDTNAKGRNLREFLTSWNDDEDEDEKHKHQGQPGSMHGLPQQHQHPPQQQAIIAPMPLSKSAALAIALPPPNPHQMSSVIVTNPSSNSINKTTNLPDIINDVKKSKTQTSVAEEPTLSEESAINTTSAGTTEATTAPAVTTSSPTSATLTAQATPNTPETEQSMKLNREKLYILETIEVPISELNKYKHLSVINKLPENIFPITDKEFLLSSSVEHSLKFIEEIESNREIYYRNDLEFGVEFENNNSNSNGNTVISNVGLDESVAAVVKKTSENDSTVDAADGERTQHNKDESTNKTIPRNDSDCDAVVVINDDDDDDDVVVMEDTEKKVIPTQQAVSVVKPIEEAEFEPQNRSVILNLKSHQQEMEANTEASNKRKSEEPINEYQNKKLKLSASKSPVSSPKTLKAICHEFIPKTLKTLCIEFFHKLNIQIDLAVTPQVNAIFEVPTLRDLCCAKLEVEYYQQQEQEQLHQLQLLKRHPKQLKELCESFIFNNSHLFLIHEVCEVPKLQDLCKNFLGQTNIFIDVMTDVEDVESIADSDVGVGGGVIMSGNSETVIKTRENCNAESSNGIAAINSVDVVDVDEDDDDVFIVEDESGNLSDLFDDTNSCNQNGGNVIDTHAINSTNNTLDKNTINNNNQNNLNNNNNNYNDDNQNYLTYSELNNNFQYEEIVPINDIIYKREKMYEHLRYKYNNINNTSTKYNLIHIHSILKKYLYYQRFSKLRLTKFQLEKRRLSILKRRRLLRRNKRKFKESLIATTTITDDAIHCDKILIASNTLSSYQLFKNNNKNDNDNDNTKNNDNNKDNHNLNESQIIKMNSSSSNNNNNNDKNIENNNLNLHIAKDDKLLLASLNKKKKLNFEESLLNIDKFYSKKTKPTPGPIVNKCNLNIYKKQQLKKRRIRESFEEASSSPIPVSPPSPMRSVSPSLSPSSLSSSSNSSTSSTSSSSSSSSSTSSSSSATSSSPSPTSSPTRSNTIPSPATPYPATPSPATPFAASPSPPSSPSKSSAPSSPVASENKPHKLKIPSYKIYDSSLDRKLKILSFVRIERNRNIDKMVKMK